MIEHWIRDRQGSELKMRNVPAMAEVFDAMRKHSIPYVDMRGALSFSEGSPVIKLVRLMRLNDFRFQYGQTGLWKDYPVTHSDYQFYCESLYKYEKDQVDKVEYDFDGVFFLQNPDSADRSVTIKVMQWARDNRSRVVFKAHPCPYDKRSNADTWRSLESLGLVSEYTVFEPSACNDYLIDNASFVLSAQSAVCAHAFIKGKPCATFRANDWSEVIPVISDVNQLGDPMDAESRSQFLSWHRQVYSLEVGSTTFGERVKSRVQRLRSGSSIADTLKAETDEHR